MSSNGYRHTPGPWHWAKDDWNGGFSGLFGPNDQDVCIPLCRNDGDDGAAWFDPADNGDNEQEIAANFRLIATAPQMLTALSIAQGYLRSQQNTLTALRDRASSSGAVDWYNKRIENVHRVCNPIAAAINAAKGESNAQ